MATNNAIDIGVVPGGGFTYTFPSATSTLYGTGTGTITSSQLATSLTDETGTGVAVFATSPTLVTPTLGVATVTSVNKVAITAPATSATLTIANGKTLTVNNSLTLSGTDSTTLTFQGTDTYVGRTTTDTLTNKRITRRLTTTNAPGASPSTNTNNVDIQSFTGIATAITSMTTNLSGTANDGDLLEFRFLDAGTAETIGWGTSFVATTVALPTTTVISTTLRVLFEWRAASSKWECLAVA